MIDKNKIPAHILDSLGFVNLEIALQNVFRFDITDSEMVCVRALEKVEEKELYKDDFRLYLKLQDVNVSISIENTREFGGMWRGTGGRLFLFIEDLSGEQSPWMEGDDGRYYDFLNDKVTPDELDYLNYEGSSARDEKNLEQSLQILKRYLSHDKIYLKAKEKIEAAIQQITEMNQIISDEWKGQSFKEYLKIYQQVEEELLPFLQLLETGDKLLQGFESTKPDRI